MDPKVKAKDGINASTWNLVDRSLTSAKIRPLSGIVPSTIDTKYSVELVGGKVIGIDTIRLGRCDVIIGIVASEQRAELFDRIGMLERDNLRLGGMLCVERNRVDRLRVVLVCRHDSTGFTYDETDSEKREIRMGRKGRSCIQLLKRTSVCSAPILALPEREVRTCGLKLLKQILSAQSEARKEENFINEDLRGMIKQFKSRSPYPSRPVIVQKPIADVRRKPLEFQVGDKVMLKVSLEKGVIRFAIRGESGTSYFGPFKIIAKVGTVAYSLELPEKLSRIHSTFNVSKLKKCMADEPHALPLDEIQVDDKLNFNEEPVEVMDCEEGGTDTKKRLKEKAKMQNGLGMEKTSERTKPKSKPERQSSQKVKE
ncbi:hypothetical protein Tco_0014441 [Tanacetum coccineum]